MNTAKRLAPDLPYPFKILQKVYDVNDLTKSVGCIMGFFRATKDSAWTAVVAREVEPAIAMMSYVYISDLRLAPCEIRNSLTTIKGGLA